MVNKIGESGCLAIGMGVDFMLRNILIIGAAATCLVVPAAAESYVRGDGCGGTYIDRKSEMMAGNLSGGTRYKCTPFPRTSEAVYDNPQRFAAFLPVCAVYHFNTLLHDSAPNLSLWNGHTFCTRTDNIFSR